MYVNSCNYVKSVYDFDILIVQDEELVDILEDMQLRSNLVEKKID